MPDSNVSSCVLNILGSFSSSLGLYKKLKEKRRGLRRPRKNEKVEGEEELRLSRSLRQGPEHISQEYQNSLYAAGDHFAVGDAIAQTSLAEVLLRLNVGLVGIITSFVSNSSNDVQLDYKGLADLSERSRIDTCRALRQLFKRLTHFPPPPPQAIMSREHAESSRTAVKAASTSDLSSSTRKRSANNRSSDASRPKIRGPTLAQVVIQDSSKPPQIAMVRPGGERRRKSRSASTSDLSSSTSSAAAKTHRHDSKLNSPTGTPPPAYTAHPQKRPKPGRSKTTPADIGKAHRKPSPSANPTTSSSSNQVPTTIQASRSVPRLPTTATNLANTTPSNHAPPLPPLPFLTSAPSPPSAEGGGGMAAAASSPSLPLQIPRRQRKQTPTFYSIATDSTKLGEIPLHKWATPYDFDQMSALNRAAYDAGWPNEREGRDGGGRKRGGLFGLFRRKGRGGMA